MSVLSTYAAAYMSRDIANSALVTRHLLDTLGAWIAGRHSIEGQEILRSVQDSAVRVKIGMADEITREIAITRLTEVDDIHRASCTTCGAVIIPAAFLLAEHIKPDANTFMRAIAHGYEAMIRLGQAVNGPAILAKGIWPSYLAAPIGAAVTASVLLKLDAERAAHAMAIAIQQMSGAVGAHPIGKSARWLIIGSAARAGIDSALMAKEHYQGDLTLLDEGWMERTHGIRCDPTPFHNLTPIMQETSLKPWCSAKQTISAIDAFRDLLKRGLDLENIAKIKIAVPQAYQKMISGMPPGRLGRIVNAGWQLGLSAYAPEHMLGLDRDCGASEAQVSLLAQKVDVVSDARLDIAYPKAWPARVTVEMNDGSVHIQNCDNALGDPEHPMSQPALEEKFAILTQGRAKIISELCASSLNDQSLARLMHDLRQILN